MAALCPFRKSGKWRPRRGMCPPELLRYEVTAELGLDDANTFQNPRAFGQAVATCVDSPRKLLTVVPVLRPRSAPALCSAFYTHYSCPPLNSPCGGCSFSFHFMGEEPAASRGEAASLRSLLASGGAEIPTPIYLMSKLMLSASLSEHRNCGKRK